MNIIGTIWATTQERAERMLREMEHRYAFCGHKTTGRMRNQCNFDNGDIWRARIASWEMTHGVRCHIGYIDSAIHPDIIQEAIIPCCSLLPFNAVHYFNYDVETFEGDE